MAAKTQELSFNVLDLLSRERTSYGLREHDYDRYRHHISNKVHRLRQVTGLSCGGNKGFKKPANVADVAVKDVKHLQLLLFLAERAYAHSQSILAQLTKAKTPSTSASSTEPTLSPKALKKDQISKLRKAVSYAQELDAVTTSVATAGGDAKVSVQTRLEILSYLLFLQATLAFHRGNFEAALPPSILRHHLLSSLSSSATSSYSQALYSEALDAGEPLIRFCAYKLGRKDTHDVEGIVSEFDAEARDEVFPGYASLLAAYSAEAEAATDSTGKSSGKRGTLEPITWANEPVEIRNAGVVDAMVKAQVAIKALEGKQKEGKTVVGKSMNRWDAVLSALGDAEAVARRAAEDDQANQSTRQAASSSSQSSPSFVHQYISHLLLTYRIRRDLLLVSSLRDPLKRVPASTLVLKAPTAKNGKPYGKQPLTRAKKAEGLKNINAKVKLFDGVLQGLGQMRELGIVEEREESRRGAEGLEAYFKAVRCTKLAQMYLLLPTPDFSPAAHLASQASTYLADARYALGFDSEDAPMTTLDLFHPITADQDIAPLEKQARELENATKRALYAELNGRPLFYDTAFNYVDLPMDELEVAAGRQPAPSTPAAPVAQALAAVSEVVAAPVQAVEGAVKTVKKTVLPESRGRESTPGPDGEAEDGKGGKSGWFGGLWGGRK